MKKLVCFFIIILFLLGNVAFADDELEGIDENFELPLTVSSNSTDEPITYSKHIICMERSTMQVLFEKDAYTRTAMASTTKILTGIIAIEKCDLNEKVEISKKAAGTGGSTLGITANTQMTIESLLYGLLLRSGNDCAVAIAEYIGGNVENFSNIMNEKAKDLKLNNSNFVTPHGLDNDEHYTTAYDLAVLTNYALNNEIFKKIVATKQVSIMINNSFQTLNNTNELLGYVEGVYGVKTGFTGNAGRCLVTACKRGDLDVIIVVLGADTKKIRGLDSKNVIEYIFSNYEMVDTQNIIDRAFTEFKTSYKLSTYKAVGNIELNMEKLSSYVYPVNKNEISNLKSLIYSVTVIDAPISANTKVGEIKLVCGKNVFYYINIVVVNDIPKKNTIYYMEEFLSEYKNYYKVI